VRRLLALASALTLAGCAPALDWRETRPQGSTVRLMVPCRPASHMRQVQLGGAMVEMSMFSCAVGSTVYALTFADMKDPALVGPALDDLARAVQSHVEAPVVAASQALAVPGMTPHTRAAQWRLSGRLPDGRTVQERSALFSHGTRVYQATMLGASLDAEAQETFFGALKVMP
jgi:hypothetical protein